MILTLMRYCNKYFPIYKNVGEQHIIGNVLISPMKAFKGMYILIQGSVFNDGLYEILEQNEEGIILEGDLIEENFEGCIYLCKPPKDFIDLAKKINDFKNENKSSNMISEKLGNYSYTKATNKNGVIATWKDVFEEEIKQYRALFDDLSCVSIYKEG